MIISRAFTSFVLMAVAPFQLAAFTHPATATNASRRTPSNSNGASASRSTFQLDLSAIDPGRTIVIDNVMGAYRPYSYQRHIVSERELDDSYYMRWELKLLNDAINTRSYICRCLVEFAEQSEEESYRKMKHAHEHGEAVIGEYSCEEHAEHYKEALESRGVNCEIFPVEE